jgi:hypothetical protein
MNPKEDKNEDIDQLQDTGDVYDKNTADQDVDTELDDIEGKKGRQAGDNDDNGEGSGTGKKGGTKEKGDEDEDDNKGSDDSAERLAVALETAIARASGKQDSGKPQLTPEQIKKLLNPIEITPEVLKGLGIAEPTEEQVKAYQAFTGMITKHMVSVMNLREENLMRKITEYATPMERFYQEQAAQRERDSFYKEFPKLQKFDKFVKFAATQVKPTDERGREKTLAQVRKEVANYTKNLLKDAGVDLDASGDEEDNDNGSNTTHGAPESRGSGVPRMSSMQTGGRSGGTNKGGGGNNPDADIYD